MAFLRAGAAITVLGVGLALAGCGGDPVPAESCSFFPDDCPDELQCSLDGNRAGELLCDAQGLRAPGEECDPGSPDREAHCGRDLLCIVYGSPVNQALCTRLCLADEDCAGELAAPRCTPSSDPEFTVCALR